MINKFIICIILSLFSIDLLSKDKFSFSILEKNGDEKAVLVLAPGMNTDGSFFFERISVG